MSPTEKTSTASQKTVYTLVIHGGAGTMSRANASPEQLARYRLALSAALKAGYAVLSEGGEAMDAAVAAVSSMEDNPLFNAGKGAVFNTEGKNELEASIMLTTPPSSHSDIPASRRGIGATLLTHAKNPSQVVRALYLEPEAAPHSFLSAAKAEEIAERSGCAMVDPSYFFTERRWREHRRELGLPLDLPEGREPDLYITDSEPLDLLPKGTVGAVALDIHGCIASVTSTGGRTNKLPGRIGDTPVMGAGYWAEEWVKDGWIAKAKSILGLRGSGKTAVGLSGTGQGDYFIRLSACASVAHRMRFLGESVQVAAQKIIDELEEACHGSGGIIGLDLEGNVAFPLNSEGMYRGVIRVDGVPHVAIFAQDPLEAICR